MTPQSIQQALQQIVSSPEAHKRSILKDIEKIIKRIGEDIVEQNKDMVGAAHGCSLPTVPDISAITALVYTKPDTVVLTLSEYVTAGKHSLSSLGSAAVRGEAVSLTNEEIDMVWQSMPGGPSHWLKGFGYQNFARAIECEYQLKSVRAADAPSEPSDDLMQELENVLMENNWRGDLVERIRESRAADALDSQPTDDGKLLCAMEFEAVELGYAGLAEAMAALRRMKADPDADREALIACLGDDAATLSHINPGDEMAQTMREAIAMLESDEVIISTLGMASSQPTDGGVRK